jgi:hypothetical protein
VGSEIHQRVIDTSRDGLDMAASANDATWHTLSQVPISGFRRPDGSPYTMCPMSSSIRFPIRTRE